MSSSSDLEDGRGRRSDSADSSVELVEEIVPQNRRNTRLLVNIPVSQNPLSARLKNILRGLPSNSGGGDKIQNNEKSIYVSPGLKKEHPGQKIPLKIRRLSSSSSCVSTPSSNEAYNPTHSDSSSDSDNPSSNRSHNKRVCYKEMESSDDDEFSSSDYEPSRNKNKKKRKIKINSVEEIGDKIDKVLDVRFGKIGATGTSTVRYIVDDFDDPNLTLPESTPLEQQFLIKWLGQSHLHNTWESVKTLKEMNIIRMSKIDNFVRKDDLYNSWRDKADAEDVEYQECQRQLEQELTKSYLNAERIIGKDKGDNGQIEFFVKWECLPYSEATWETGELINRYYPEVVDRLEKRIQASTIPGRSPFDNSKVRPRFFKRKSQPDYMKGVSKNLILRDYQIEGVNWLVNSWCKRNSVILGDEMGLGKTIQAICFLSHLFEAHKVYGPFLLVVPLSTLSAWEKEFSLWAPQMNVITYLGNEESRQIIRENEWYIESTKLFKFNALLTTYETIVKDRIFLASQPWAVTVVDEAHRLKNIDSMWHTSLAQYKSYHTLLMTGTPIQNSLKELWSLLHFIMPYKFQNWESFEMEHKESVTDGYNKLHAQLEPFLIRRVKKDVEKSLPLKKEQILRVEMTKQQIKFYKWILTKNFAALKKESKGSKQCFLNMAMQLRKCCNHTALLKGKNNDGLPEFREGENAIEELLQGSGKLMLLDKLLVRLKTMGHRVLIFSQFVIMLDIIEELLELRRFAFQRLDGSTRGDLRQQALIRFNAEDSKDFCFLLSTRAGGLGINLASANTVIIFDSDWNPQNDLQAQARAHRIGQKRQVNVYRFVTKNSIEENIIELAKKKMVLDHLVIQRMDTTGRTVLGTSKAPHSKTSGFGDFDKAELNAILKFGAEELFKENKGEDEYVCDIDEILRLADMETPAIRETEIGLPCHELLSAFKVVSFANDAKDWEEIIPENLRGKWEAEEMDRKHDEYMNLQRSSRKARKKKTWKNDGTPTKKLKTEGNEEEENKDGTSDSSVCFSSHSSETDESIDEDLMGKKLKHSDLMQLDKNKKRNGYLKTVSVPVQLKQLLLGFTQEEVRRFMTSFKKFPRPMSRLKAIAQDSNLMSKTLEDLRKLGELILLLVSKVMTAETKDPPHLAAPTSNGDNFEDDCVIIEEDAKPLTASIPVIPAILSTKRPSSLDRYIFKFDVFPNYKINARNIVNVLNLLEPLGAIIPADDKARKNWRFDLPTQNPNFHIEWGQEEDTMLLVWVWEHGYTLPRINNLEKLTLSLREDVPLLKEKIFLGGDQLPQIRHIYSRFHHLLSVMRIHTIRNRPTNLHEPVPGGTMAGNQTIVKTYDKSDSHRKYINANFTTDDVKKFIISFKEFPHPMTRLSDISVHAGLQEKSIADLRKLGEYILDRCQSDCVTTKIDAVIEPTPCSSKYIPLPKNSTGGITKKEPANSRICKRFSLSGCPINVRSMCARLEKLKGLGDLIPMNQEKRSIWKFDYQIVKPVNFNVEWGAEEDTRLLLGLWKHGISNVAAVRANDPILAEKIFEDIDQKQPNEKSVLARTEQLLKVIKKNELKLSKLKNKRTKKFAETVLAGVGKTPSAIATNMKKSVAVAKKNPVDRLLDNQLPCPSKPIILKKRTVVQSPTQNYLSKPNINDSDQLKTIPIFKNRNSTNPNLKRKQVISVVDTDEIFNRYPEFKSKTPHLVLHRLDVSVIKSKVQEVKEIL